MEVCFYHGYTFPDTILENIKNFRKAGSITAGHREFNKSMGIESIIDVGMAVSFKNLSAIFNTNNQKIIDNNCVYI
jgi:transketolase